MRRRLLELGKSRLEPHYLPLADADAAVRVMVHVVDPVDPVPRRLRDLQKPLLVRNLEQRTPHLDEPVSADVLVELLHQLEEPSDRVPTLGLDALELLRVFGAQDLLGHPKDAE